MLFFNSIPIIKFQFCRGQFNSWHLEVGGIAKMTFQFGNGQSFKFSWRKLEPWHGYDMSGPFFGPMFFAWLWLARLAQITTTHIISGITISQWTTSDYQIYTFVLNRCDKSWFTKKVPGYTHKPVLSGWVSRCHTGFFLSLDKKLFIAGCRQTRSFVRHSTHIQFDPWLWNQ